MATTTNYSWTTPDDTDLVKDGAAAIRTLGTAIDSTVFTNAGNAIAKTIVDAKGDIIAATAADTVSRLAVGANDTVLTADSSTATGLKWATSSSFLPTIVDTTAARYLAPVGTVASLYLPTFNITRYTPIFVPVSLNFDRISIRTNTDYFGTSTVRLGVYNCNTSTGKPSTVKFDAGTVNASAVNTNYEITITQTLAAGYYFLAFNQQANTDDGHYWSGITQANSKQNFLLNTRGTVIGDSSVGFTESGITGAFATAGTLVASSATPVVALRIA
jgi:hypothetical protein